MTSNSFGNVCRDQEMAMLVFMSNYVKKQHSINKNKASKCLSNAVHNYISQCIYIYMWSSLNCRQHEICATLATHCVGEVFSAPASGTVPPPFEVSTALAPRFSMLLSSINLSKIARLDLHTRTCTCTHIRRVQYYIACRRIRSHVRDAEVCGRDVGGWQINCAAQHNKFQ